MDEYIDNEETQKYGPALVGKLKSMKAKEKAVAAFVGWLASQQSAVDGKVATAMGVQRGAKSASKKAAKEKAPELTTAANVLRGFHAHLKSKTKLGEWSGDIDEFFPSGVGGIGATVPTLKSALSTALDALSKDKSVPDRAKLQKKLTDAATSLSTKAGKSNAAADVARATLSEQSREKKAWLNTYHPIANILDNLAWLLSGKKPRASLAPHATVASSSSSSSKKQKQKQKQKEKEAKKAATKKDDGATPAPKTPGATATPDGAP